MDAPDTIDAAIHYLSKLQSEGWGLARIEHSVDYASATKKGKQLPVGATVTIELVPL
jgi:hypothetical protein